MAGLCSILLASALGWAPHHVLVELEPDASAGMPDTLASAGGIELEPLLPAGSALSHTALGRTFVLVLDPSVDPAVAVELLASLDGVVRAGVDPRGRGADVIPDDHLFEDQWYLHDDADADVNAPAAWERTTGGDVLVAVVDTGVDFELNPQLAGIVEPGWDFVNDDDDPVDDHGHGTVIASVIAARGNDGRGIAGVCWGCRILSVKVLDENNEGFYSDWVQGIDLAVSSGAAVINLSMGGDRSSAELETAVTAARDAGVVVIAAMMNDGDEVPYYPAAYGATIAVGATDRRGRRADLASLFGWASSYGDHIDLCAPGVDIVGTSLGGVMEEWSGTSLAVPLVCGGAALVLTLHPAAEPEQVREALRLTATDGDGLPSEDTEGWDPYHGAGRLDLDRLTAVAAEGFTDADGDGVLAGLDCDDEDPGVGEDCPGEPGPGSCGCSLVW
jgi:subtilisin family serine protease